MRKSRVLVGAAAVAGLVVSSASAADYHFDILVETGDIFAGRSIVNIAEQPQISLNVAGQFVFRDENANEERTIYRGSIHDPGQAAVVYGEGQTFGGVGVVSTGQVLRLNQAGQIAFVFESGTAVPQDWYPAVIARDTGIVLQPGDTIDGETYSGTVSEGIALNDSGTIAHFSKLPTPQPVPAGYNFEGSERLVIGGVLVKRPDDADGNKLDTLAGEHFEGFHQDSRIDLNDSGAYLVSYWKDGEFDDALAYVNGPTETLLAHKGDAFLDGGVATGETIVNVSRTFGLNNQGDTAYSVFLMFDPQDPNEEGRVAFVLDGHVAVTDGDTVDGLTMTQLNESSLLLTESGRLVYGFYFDNGIDPWGGTALVFGDQLVASSGMTIDGRLVSQVFSEGVGVNDLGQLAFGVRFDDGSTAVVLATVPEPATVGILAVASAGLLFRRRRRA